MDFPLEIASPCEPPPDLLTGLAAKPVWVGRNRLDYVVEVVSEEVLRSLKPDLSALASIETRGFVVTAWAATPQLSRYDYSMPVADGSPPRPSDRRYQLSFSTASLPWLAA